MALTADDYQVQIRIKSDTGLPEDEVVNTWAVKALDAGATFAAGTTAFDTFYNGISAYLAATVAPGTNAEARWYHLNEPLPRVPVYSGTFAIGGLGATALPAEVAICSSFSAAVESGVNPARRRGRVFLGPLSTTPSSVIDGYARVSNAARVGITTEMLGLVGDLATANWQLCVWSRSDDTLFPVVRGWVNDEFDTQRRRGPRPTGRTSWVVP